ncbi:DNA cytosine methyltransferase [Lactobacillus taiwanensis]|uniref:DNA cytosine methyltransferase n=1 Tax=Lactobacillus taiwanensis TaxID=508451 RepID=UPI0025A9B2D5|nr:DNA cytosine methyltransferase [Lactobacillus taiwanensis]
MKTYVSLFSSAGVGDYGFYQAGFKLLASNELLQRRLNVQLANHIADKHSAYILGDITDKKVKNKIITEVNNYYKNVPGTLDLLVATPPCQGISVANHFKTGEDIKRNSLVLESILIAEKLHPKFIVFENVKRFLTTACTDIDGKTYEIKSVINKHLSRDYNIFGQELNFKDYGANSSRPRTLVISVRKDISINPKDLMPKQQETKTLKEVIGDLPSLSKMGEITKNDILHTFRPYREDMRNWIHPLKQGQSAFDNKDPMLRPHRIMKGQIVPNVKKNGDKYTRQYWNKVGPAIHTRNDILASQNTVHPTDDRVFSIRELMRLMNVPSEFKWSSESYKYLNSMSLEDKKKWLKQHAITIRQSLGEAVPTIIFKEIGDNINLRMDQLNAVNKVKENN